LTSYNTALVIISFQNSTTKSLRVRERCPELEEMLKDVENNVKEKQTEVSFLRNYKVSCTNWYLFKVLLFLNFASFFSESASSIHHHRYRLCTCCRHSFM